MFVLKFKKQRPLKLGNVPVILGLERWMKEDQEFKVTLSNMVNLLVT